jgi:hypothetical protein
MGDMADWANDNGEIEKLLYGYGGEKSCYYCGQDNLHWIRMDSGKWRLAEEDGCVHSCSVATESREKI